MPQLRVEYAKSGRARCALTGCGQAIVKHEVRIGTAFVFPTREGNSRENNNNNNNNNKEEEKEGEGGEYVSYKWRHLCCFTEKQIQNAKASGDFDNIEGFHDLAPADQALINKMKCGELWQKSEIKGRVGDVANSPLAAELLPKKKTTTSASSTPGRKRKNTTSKEEEEEKEKETKKEKKEETPVKVKAPVKKGAGTSARKRAHDTIEAVAAGKSDEINNNNNNNNNETDGNASDATEEFEVSVEVSKPKCPYGENCFRTGAEHFAEYAHGTETDNSSPARPRAIIKGKKE